VPLRFQMTCPPIHIETIDDAKTILLKFPPLILNLNLKSYV